jgi:hypothetical protein
MQQLLWRRFGFQNLLFWLFAYLLVNPFLSSVPHSRLIFQLMLTLRLLKKSFCKIYFSSESRFFKTKMRFSDIPCYILAYHDNIEIFHYDSTTLLPLSM